MYRIKRYSPRGSPLATYTPDGAYTPAMSLRVTGHGDCRNGVINQFARKTGVQVGDLLEVWLNDGSGEFAAYAGEVRIAPGASLPTSADLNLAGLRSRLDKMDVRSQVRLPQTGELHPEIIARQIAEDTLPQAGQAMTYAGGVFDQDLDGVALRPNFVPLSAALDGLAGRIPGAVWGVDGERRVFFRPAAQDVLELDAAAPGVTLEPRMVSGEALCTAVRWHLGIGADGHPISHLSVSEAAAKYGEHVHAAEVSDGLLYLRRLDARYEVRSATAQTYRDGDPVGGANFDVLTDGNPATRLVLTAEGSEISRQPVLAVYAPTGRELDVLRIVATANTPRISNYNAFDAIGATEPGDKGLDGLYTSWDDLGKRGWIATGGLPEPAEDGSRKGVLDLATVEAYEIDRAALDRQAEALYRLPHRDPVAIRVHGRYLRFAPTVRCLIPGETAMVAEIAELEYVAAPGWWGTVVHVGQAQDGVALARAEAIAERDSSAAGQVRRGQAGQTMTARRGDG